MRPALNRDEWADPIWRLHNLYSIVDKAGDKQPFIPNDEQRHFLENYWYLNIILKARQLGFSTLIDLILLDQALWVPNTKSHIIAQGLEEATEIFRTKVKFPYENLSPGLLERFPTKTDNKSQLEFTNGSLIGVGVSARSGTVQYLHVTELGKISRKFPEKAKEIESGALQSVAAGQYVFIESTAEGIGGLFHDQVKKAQAFRKTSSELSEMDYKLHFYPWHVNTAYQSTAKVDLTSNELKYFAGLEKSGVRLSAPQKAWYALKQRSFKDPDTMLQEYPSTEDEPFKASNEDKFFGPQMAAAEAEGRIHDFGIASTPVHCFWDLGRDGMPVLFMQEVHGEPRFIDCLFSKASTVTETAIEIQRLGYLVTDHWLPHDGADKSATSKDDPRSKLRAAFPNARVHVGQRAAHKMNSINAARDRLKTVRIHATKCAELAARLRGYRKTWNNALGIFTDEPVHDECSHYADAFMVFATDYKPPKATEEHFPYVASRGGRTGY